MDFALSPRVAELAEQLWDFMREQVFPAEPGYHAWLAENDTHGRPPVLDELKAEAKKRGL